MMRISVLTTLILGWTLLWSDASVWKVSHGSHVLYLGGTVHVLRASDFPLPGEYDRAYKASDLVVFETDLEAARGPKFREAILQKMLLPEGTTLQDIVTDGTYRALKEYLESTGQTIEQYRQLQPWMVVLVLTAERLQDLGIDAEGVDNYFDLRAAEEGKPRRGLVGVDEHLEIITTLGAGEEDAMIRNTIEEMEAMPEMMGWMLEEWRAGRLNRMTREVLDPMADAFPKVYESVFTARNRLWMRSLETMLEDDPVEFVLVGTLHMAGEDGLIRQLRERGYRVTLLQ